MCKKWVQKWERFKEARENFEEVSPQMDIKVCNKYGDCIDLIYAEFAERPLKSSEEVFSRGETRQELTHHLKFFLYCYEAHTGDLKEFLEKCNIWEDLPLRFYYRTYRDNRLYSLGIDLKEEIYADTNNKVLFGDIDFGTNERVIVP